MARSSSPLTAAPSPLRGPGRTRLSDERGRAAGAFFFGSRRAAAAGALASCESPFSGARHGERSHRGPFASRAPAHRRRHAAPATQAPVVAAAAALHGAAPERQPRRRRGGSREPALRRAHRDRERLDCRPAARRGVAPVRGGRRGSRRPRRLAAAPSPRSAAAITCTLRRTTLRAAVGCRERAAAGAEVVSADRRGRGSSGARPRTATATVPRRRPRCAARGRSG